MSDLEIFALPVGRGLLGLSAMPGLGGDYLADLRSILRWGPSLVVSLTEAHEPGDTAARLCDDLRHASPDWAGLPIADYGVPDAAATLRWVGLEQRITARLAAGRRVLVHCRGGCGRSGMIVLRLMVLHGEAPDAALARLRALRPCAVETPAQRLWATR